MINPLIFRAYDIRGIAIATPDKPADLTPETVRLIGLGTGTYMRRTYGTKNMLVGRDNRLHSPELQQAFIEGVLSTGIDVIDIGLSTSPLLYYAVCKFGIDSGVNITASHNPKAYNGVKIVGRNAHSVCGEELQHILKLIEKKDFDQGSPAGKLTSKDDHFQTYLQEIKDRIQLSRPLKVVVDAGNGTAGKFAPELLRAIGCEVIELYCELDGNYPHHEANPEEEKNMRDLGELVRKEQADLGIGFDGDGDRVGIVDEKGQHYSADYLLLLLAADLLEKAPGSQIIFDVKVSKILIDEITRLGGIPVMSKTGHSFIEARMHELNAPLGGEISGHMFFGRPYYDYYGFDDAFLAACKILEILAQKTVPKLEPTSSTSALKSTTATHTTASSKIDLPHGFSELFNHLPHMETTPEFKAHCPDDQKFRIVEELTRHFTRTHQCITIDGVRVNFDEKAWGAVRCSNTSPNLTLRFEADSKQKLADIQAEMVEVLKHYPEVDLSWYHSS